MISYEDFKKIMFNEKIEEWIVFLIINNFRRT
jgi:hypothetical protein